MRSVAVPIAICCLLSTAVAREIPNGRAERVGMSTDRLPDANRPLNLLTTKFGWTHR